MMSFDFYRSPYQNLDQPLPAHIDYFSPCYPDYDEGFCPLPFRERTEMVLSGLAETESASTSLLLSHAVLQATEQILTERIVDESSMIKVYGTFLAECVRSHPEAAFGRLFSRWGRGAENLHGENCLRGSAGSLGSTAINVELPQPYGSCGSGAAVRAGIIGAIHEDIDVVMTLARASAMPTHNHPAGVRGAMVTAVLVWMALHEADKQEMEHYLLWNYPNTYYRSHGGENRGRKNVGVEGAEQEAAGPETAEQEAAVRDGAGKDAVQINHAAQNGDELSPQDIHGGTSLSELIRYGEKQKTYGCICQYVVPEAVINFLYSDSMASCMKNAQMYPCDIAAVSAVSAQIGAVFYGLHGK